jgi:nucleotide-binding universal stress UspA family protein
MYKRILVPIDGSDTAKRGLKEAIALAADQKAALYVLHVTSDFPIMLEMANIINFDQYREGLRQVGRQMLDEAKMLAGVAGVEAETQLRDLNGGRVAEAIVQEAKSTRCDLIVIGTHGRRGFRRALLGSDAEAVLREAPAPVLLVRASEAAG